MKGLFFINEDILRYEIVIIYGSGNAGQALFLRLFQLNVKVECFADSDPEKCGQRFMNIPIVHIDDLNSLRETAAMIVSGRYALEVASELEKRGFAHIFFDYGTESGYIHLKRDEAN